MAKKDNGKKKKSGWLWGIGLFCIFGAFVMLTANIAASFFYFVVAIVCFSCIVIKKKLAQSHSETSEIVEGKSKSTDITYVINPETMVFHRPTCIHAQKTYSFNKYSCTSRSAIIAIGYKPCKHCKP